MATASAPSSAPTASGGSVYDEQLYLSLLTHINTTERRVDALCRLALRHLPRAAETWSAIRKAFVATAAPQSLPDLDGDANRALWCLVDALIKTCTHVFAPLLSPRLLEYVTQQTPLMLMSTAANSATALMLFGGDTAGDGGSSGSGIGAGQGVYSDAESEAQRAASWRWWEALILSWEPFLPADGFAPVRYFLTQRKSLAELDGAMAQTANGSGGSSNGDGNGIGGSGSARGQPASPADMQQLQEEWSTLKYLCSSARTTSGAGGHRGFSFEELLASFASAEAERAEGSATTTVSAAMTTAAVGTRAAASKAGNNISGPGSSGDESGSEDSDGDDDDGSYVPEYIAGAKPRQLPDLGLPAQRRRRDNRRRQRDEDY